MQDEDETHNLDTQHLSESQEIVVGNSGRAILLGDELADLESVHGRSAPYPATKKRGPCPAWLQRSSPKMKAILGIIAIVLLAFVAVLITGATQLSGGSGSIQSDKNVVTDLLETTPAPTPRLSLSPTTAKDNEGSSSSSTPNETVSAVYILLPDSLESTVPNFADGLSANEQHNWDILEEHIENTIIEAISERLPEGFLLESVQIEKFDGYDTTSMRRKKTKNTRHLQTNSDSSAAKTTAVHSVFYASLITVDCAESDCSTAADIVAEITSELSQLEFLTVEDVVETVAPAGSTVVGGSPTESPITSISSSTPTTLAPSVSITMEPSSVSPTQAVTNATEAPLPLFIREEFCTVDSLCGRCEGKWPLTYIQRNE